MSNKTPLIVVVFFVLLSMHRLDTIPTPWTDEIVHLNIADNINKCGRMYTDFYNNKFKNICFAALPLHSFLLSQYIKLSDMDLSKIRLLFIGYAVLMLIGVYFLAKKLFDKKTANLAVFLLAISHLFFTTSRNIEPYMASSMCGVWSLLALYSGRYILSGILAGLGSMFHGFGAIPLAIAVISRFSYSFMAAYVITILPYVFLVITNLNQYLVQTDFIIRAYGHHDFINNILREPFRYFNLENFRDFKRALKNLNLKLYLCDVLPNAIFLISVLYVSCKKEWKLITILAAYLIVLSLHPNKFPMYICIILPYFSISLAYFIKNTNKKIASVVFILFISVNSVYIYKYLTTDKILPYQRFIDTEIKTIIPKNSTILAPQYFWVGMHKDYNFVSVNEIVYALEAGGKIDDLIKRYKIDYILMTWHDWWGDLTDGMKHAEHDVDVKEYVRKYKKIADFIGNDSYFVAGGFTNINEEYRKSLKIYKVK